MESPRGPLAERLASIHEELDVAPGVMYGVIQLPLLDPITDELYALASALPDPAHPFEPPLLREIERLVDLLAGPWIGAASEAQGRRLRLVELLRRAERGRLPARAFDPADAFGAEMRVLLETDPDLAATLGRLLPLLARATSVTPSARWLADAAAEIRPGEASTEAAASTIRRSLAVLVRTDIVSRPDILTGGVRLANQRLARGLLWLAAATLDTPAGLLGIVGVRMGTSGRSDAVVRDTALANTCAALLGASVDPGAPAALASMRVRITNRNVLKQVDRALGEQAQRAGTDVATLVELALPTFGLDARRRIRLPVGDSTATIELRPTLEVGVEWQTSDGRREARAPSAAEATKPGEVAEVKERVTALEAAVAEERRRMEDRLASDRAWPEPIWRARFVDHPIGGLFGPRLVWVLGPSGETKDAAALPVGEGWVGSDGRPLPGSEAGRLIRLWHPADADPEEVAAWRAEIAARHLDQPIRQVDRETFRPEARDTGLVADRRFAGRVVAHDQLRALLRPRGWAVPALGAWDQGDEATAWRAFDGEIRAELRYQAVERLLTGERQERARIVAVRFVGSPRPGATADIDAAVIRLDEVAPRVLSEAIRDVSLVVTVAGTAPGG